MQITIGRTVLFRLPSRFPGEEALRPAHVVNAWPGHQNANLAVMLDPANDGDRVEDLRRASLLVTLGTDGPVLAHACSAGEGTGEGQWRWPPRVGA